MAGIERVTDATLDVLEVLLRAYRDGRDCQWLGPKARLAGPVGLTSPTLLP